MTQETPIAVYDCHSDHEDEWYDFEANLKYGTLRGTEFYLIVTNGNWRGQTGYCFATGLSEVARKLTSFHDGQCTTKVYLDKRANELRAIVYHHDCPTGSSVRVMTKSKAIRQGEIINLDDY